MMDKLAVKLSHVHIQIISMLGIVGMFTMMWQNRMNTMLQSSMEYSAVFQNSVREQGIVFLSMFMATTFLSLNFA